MPINPRDIYIFDTTGRRPTAEKYNPPTHSPPVATPTLETIQGLLQTPLGVSKPNSLLSLNSKGRLDSLKVSNIYYAKLDGGNF